MAQLRHLEEQFGDALVVIGVHSAKFPSESLSANIRQAVMREGITHPVVNDVGMRIWSDYAVRAWPTLVLIDPTGRIVGETSGEILAEEMAQEIRDVLEKHGEAVSSAPVGLITEIEGEPERPFAYPAKILLAAGGNLFIADTGHHRIVQVQLDLERSQGEVVRTFGSGAPGFTDGAADVAQFQGPRGMALRGSVQDGVLYVADSGNHAIRAIELASGLVRTAAGTGEKAHGSFQLGRPLQTPLRSPWALVSLENYLLIAMAGSHQVWVMINEDQIGPFAGTGAEALVDGPLASAAFNQPSDLVYGMGYLFVADAEASAVRAVQMTGDAPETITLVGQGLFAYGDVDGPGETALLQHASGLALEENMLYVADTYNHKIKLLDPVKGEIETLIGSGEPGLADGSFATARLFEPEGVQVRNGKVYIADTNNHVIRVGDLDTRTLVTLELRELDRLRMPRPAHVGTLPLVRVAPGGKVALDVQIPPGYKRNPDAPARVQFGAQSYTFTSAEEIVFPVESQSNADVPLEVTLYYCTEENHGLCLIHDRRWWLPVQVDAAAAALARVAYPVN